MNPAVDAIIVFTPDGARLASWYRDVLGLGEPEVAPGHHGFRIGNLLLGFDDSEQEYARPGVVTVWIWVDDVDAVFERAVVHGADVRYAPVEKPWGDRLAAVVDPDGNVLGLAGTAGRRVSPGRLFVTVGGRW